MPEVTLPASTTYNFCNKDLPSFRLAKTSPIFNHGAKIQTHNYRPVANLSAVS